MFSVQKTTLTSSVSSARTTLATLPFFPLRLVKGFGLETLITLPFIFKLSAPSSIFEILSIVCSFFSDSGAFFSLTNSPTIMRAISISFIKLTSA